MTTPLEAVRKFCVECAGGAFEIRSCGGDKCGNGGADSQGVCFFYKHRLSRGRPSVKLIRKTCLWCQGESPTLVKECEERDCPIHAFRMGRNPNYSTDTAKNILGPKVLRGHFHPRTRFPLAVGDKIRRESYEQREACNPGLLTRGSHEAQKPTFKRKAAK